jgi:hypothetical protein
MASTAGSRPGVAQPRGKAREKNFSTKIPRNPLKSPDSDEGIQGNPRESKAHFQGLSRQKGPAPRKTKWI